MFDTHLHLVNEGYDDIGRVIDDAAESGVLYLILGGCSKEDNASNINLCREYNNLFLTVGYHPSEIDNLDDSDFLLLEKQILNNKDKILGIGEIGLDYHYGKEDRILQIEVFKKQLVIAKKYNLPVIIHTRDAMQETYDILKNSGVRGIIHCFSYGKEMAREYLNMGLYLGIGGVVTFKNAKKLKEVVEYAPLEQLVLETDSPYLSPEPNRGKRNSSLNLPYVAAMIAELKGVSAEEVVAVTEENAKRLLFRK